MSIKTNVQITIYNVDQAGYYRYYEKTSPEFGDIESILSDLEVWSRDKNIEDTLIEAIEEGEGVLPTLLASIKKHTDKNWLLTLWNKVPEIDGKVLSIPGAVRVGQASYLANKVVKGSIAGFPSYFWFLPKHNVVASIRVNIRPTGPKSMQSHLKTFMRNLSQHVVKTEIDEDGNIGIAGYRCSTEDKTKKLSPRFSVSIKRKASDLKLIRSKVDLIRKTTRTEKFSLMEGVILDGWQEKIPKNLRFAFKKSNIQRVKSEQSIRANLNLQQLNLLIKEWSDNLNNSATEIDYEFAVHGDTNIYKLGKTISRDEFEFELNFEKETGIVNPESLLKELERHYKDIVVKLINV